MKVEIEEIEFGETEKRLRDVTQEQGKKQQIKTVFEICINSPSLTQKVQCHIFQ